MPVSERSSWISRSRHGAPLIMYSDSPLRNSVRVIVTSLNSIGSRFAELSIVSDTSARPSAGRSAVPAKMTSSILPPRSVRGPWAPSTHATASTRFDLPDPFGPTTTVTPGSNSSTVLSANDLKPRSVSVFRNTRACSSGHNGDAGPFRVRSQRSDGTPRVSGPGTPSRRPAPRPASRPRRRARATGRRGTIAPRGRPRQAAPRGPLRRDRRTGSAPTRSRRRRWRLRDTTRGTTRPARAPTRIRERESARSDLARRAVIGGATGEALPHDEVTAPWARPALARVDVVELLELAGPAEEVDILLVGERRAAVLHRFLERLHHRPVQPAHFLRGERVAHAVPAQTGAPQDLVAVDVADAGDELLVHEQRLELRLTLGEHAPEVLPRHRGLERIDAEVGQLADLLLHVVELGDEHLTEGSRVDETELSTLSERDHHVRVLAHGLACRLLAQQLPGHPEVDDEHVVAVEPAQQVLAAPFDADDLLADESVRELLAVVVTADGAHAVGLHVLDLLPHDLAFEIAADDFHFR